MGEWSYIRRTRHDLDQPLVLAYEGPNDLLHWIADRFDRLDDATLMGAASRSFWRAEPTFLPQRDELLQRSAASHATLLARLGAPYGEELHHPQDIYNVQDFHYCTAIGSAIRTVVDFGAGYGRQSFLFGTMLDDPRYVCVDAIEQPYMVQRWVFEQLGLGRWDYVDEADSESSFRSAFETEPGAFHLPSWRLDLLPEASVDLVLFVWSLYEMSGTAARAAIAACTRLVRPGGYVYVRDVPHSVSYRFHPERALRRAGFETTYVSRAVAADDLHGRQRLYRRVGSRGRRVPPGLRDQVRRLRATRGAVSEGRRQRSARRDHLGS